MLDAEYAAALSPDITFRLYDERRSRTFLLPATMKGAKIIIESREEEPANESEQ